MKLRNRSGRKFSGIIIIEHMTFHCVTVKTAGKSRSSESAKRTMRATQAAKSSRVNRMLVAILAFGPKEMKARSEKVITIGSRSIHLARRLAVQDVTMAASVRMIRPHTHPAYFIPMGRESKPTPTKTLQGS